MAKRKTTKALISTQRLDESVTRASSVVGQVKELFPLWSSSTQFAGEMEMWYRNDFSNSGLGRTNLPHLADSAGADIKELRDSAPTPWAKMIADALSQNLIVDGIRQSEDGSNAPAMRLWQQNGLDSRQRAVVDGTARHGKAFNLIGSATGRLDGKPTAFIRGKSALVFDAFYRDDYDEWPECALEGHLQRDADGDERWRWDFYDESAHHWLTSERDGSKMTYIAYEPHGMGMCPVTRAAGSIDLNGRVTGEIEPYITLFKRINQSTMDRLVVQRFGAFVVRYIAGIAQPSGTDEEKRAKALMLAITDLLVSPDKDTKFGSLPATPLDGYIKSREADIRDLSAVSQTPSFHMLGLADNVGAEGLAAAEASHFRKVDGWAANLGEFWEASMRLAGYAAGDPEIANDFESRVHWKDTKAQSFQSLAQGLATLAEGLGIPGEVLWGRIPDWGIADTEKALQLAKEEEARALTEATLLAAAGAQAAPKKVTSGKPASDAR